MFPGVVANATSAETGNTSSHTVSLPSGIQAGDLLLILFAVDRASGSFGVQASGWAVDGISNAGNLGLYVLSKIASGAEGASVVVTTDNGSGTPVTERSAHHAYRISNWYGLVNPTDVFTATGSSAAADPPSADVGAIMPLNDILWIVGAASDADTTFSGDPSGYGSPVENNSGSTTFGVKLRSLRRENATLIENPSAFTNTNRPWATIVFPVRSRPVRPGRRAMAGF